MVPPVAQTGDARDVTQVWPPGIRSAAFFSFDVDGESWLLNMDERNRSLPVTMSQASYGPRIGTHYVLALLKRYEVLATFFVPGWVAENYPATVEAILEHEHEIGLHGYLHECPKDLAHDEEAGILQRSIDILQSRTGRRPKGYRAPDAEVSPSTVTLLAEYGVHYSSTFVGDVFPYFHAAQDVLELPIQWSCDDWTYSMVSPHALPVAEVHPFMPNSYVLDVWVDEFSAISARGGLFVLINHPQITGRPGRLLVLNELLAHVTSQEQVWIANGEMIDDYWRTTRPNDAEPLQGRAAPSVDPESGQVRRE